MNKRFLAASLLSLALAACATTPATAPPSGPGAPPRGVVVPLPPAPQAALLLRQAGTTDAPLLEEVQRTWGQADVARREAAGALLTYRLQTCALVLGFSANSLNQMRLAAVEPGPRRFGDTPPSLDQCAAELDARRANARVG